MVTARRPKGRWMTNVGNNLEPCPGWTKIEPVSGEQVQCPDCGRRFMRRFQNGSATAAVPPHKRFVNAPVQ